MGRHAPPGHRGDRPLERIVGEGQLLGPRLDHLDRRRTAGAVHGRGGALPRPRRHSDRRLDRHHRAACRIQAEPRAGAGADLEHARAGAARIAGYAARAAAGAGAGRDGPVQSPSPTPQEQHLGRPHDGVVEPGGGLSEALAGPRRSAGPTPRACVVASHGSSTYQSGNGSLVILSRPRSSSQRRREEQ